MTETIEQILAAPIQSRIYFLGIPVSFLISFIAILWMHFSKSFKGNIKEPGFAAFILLLFPPLYAIFWPAFAMFLSVYIPLLLIQLAREK